jgi:hypothetical protein
MSESATYRAGIGCSRRHEKVHGVHGRYEMVYSRISSATLTCMSRSKSDPDCLSAPLSTMRRSDGVVRSFFRDSSVFCTLSWGSRWTIGGTLLLSPPLARHSNQLPRASPHLVGGPHVHLPAPETALVVVPVGPGPNPHNRPGTHSPARRVADTQTARSQLPPRARRGSANRGRRGGRWPEGGGSGSALLRRRRRVGNGEEAPRAGRSRCRWRWRAAAAAGCVTGHGRRAAR